MKNGEPQLTSCGSTPGRRAEGRRQGRWRVQRRAKHRLLLGHPGELQSIALPFELDEGGTDAEAKCKFFSPARDDTIVGKGERRPDHGMSGKLHFVGRTEDAEAHVRAGGLRGLDEGALREFGLTGHRLHLVGGEARGLGEYGQLVAGERLVGEDVVLQIPSAIEDRRPSDLLCRQRDRGGRRQRGDETHPRAPS
jgi:hypothetical protein